MCDKIKVYNILYNDGETLEDIKVYTNYMAALKEFLGYCVKVTKRMIVEDDDEDENDDVVSQTDVLQLSDSDNDSDEDSEDKSCVLLVYEPHDDSPDLLLTKEYDIDMFHEFVEEKDDVEIFIASLEEALEHNNIPHELLVKFSE